MKLTRLTSAAFAFMALALHAADPATTSTEEQRLETELGLNKSKAPATRGFRTRGITPPPAPAAAKERKGFRLSGSSVRGSTRGGTLAEDASPVASTPGTSTAPAAPQPYVLTEKEAQEAKIESYTAPALADSEAQLPDLLFVFNSTAFAHPEQSERALQHLANVLHRHPSARLIIEGHTCDKGEDRFNLVLSCCRAEAVAGHLIHLGIAPQRIVTLGFGESDPAEHLASHDSALQSEAKRTANRRARFRIAAEQP